MVDARAAGFARGRHVAWAACLLTLLSAAPVVAAEAGAAKPEVGTAVLIKKRVIGSLGTDERQLKTGFRVHHSELLQTGPQAQAELKLDDNTKIALGPQAELRLDEFAVGAGSDSTAIALRLLKGTLRFLTGKNASESYKIETPSATIGVRGTIFDVYIGPGGDAFILLHQGEVEICARGGACRPHRQVGSVVQATLQGIVSQPMKWAATLVPGVGVAQAFPFVGRRLVIDPVRRLRYHAITDEIRVIERGGKNLERTLKKLSPF
ncbi:MAG: FecR family protein [Hyphomonadaceae bacterium]|jgi:ferric-dicitrate binding protein FerR (iron transport regulator)|nr:FecR family protein [Hyphomonadaceae bacterium]